MFKTGALGGIFPVVAVMLELKSKEWKSRNVNML
jgi:hypothetical protein